MASINQGDDAVERLDNAVTAFEQIMTGPEGQTVAVPGHQPQPTLAERVKQNLKPSTDAAAGFAAQASASAKAADESAKLASQISGLDTVSDAVALAALPMPDVWAPLTDSLRLFVGNGREVKVGDDVVSRYVNYSRSTSATYTDKNNDTKAATINEPRFERNGLLIDGQSSNLVKVSSNRVWGNGFSAGATLSLVDSTDQMTSALCPKILRVGSEARYGIYLPSEISSPVTVGTVYTLTMRMRRLDAELGAISINGASGVINSANAPAGVWTTRTITFTANVTAVWPMTPQGEYEYAYIQLEALPFASSYIPTNGAAVARSADLATLPQSLNLGESQLGFSIAVEFDSVNTGGGRLLELSDQSSIILDGASLIVRHIGREVYGINAPLGQRHHLAYSVAANGALTVALNGKLLAPQSRSGSYPSSKSTIALGNRIAASDRAMYGHLRDLKIWTKKPLTSDQLKVASA